MSKQRVLLRQGTVITMDDGIGDFATADVLVNGEVIEAVAPDLGGADAEVIDARGMIVMPGMVDTHRHTWQAALRASPPTGPSAST